MGSDRKVWQISTIIEATAEEAEAAQEATARALCPDENHSGYCPQERKVAGLLR